MNATLGSSTAPEGSEGIQYHHTRVSWVGEEKEAGNKASSLNSLKKNKIKKKNKVIHKSECLDMQQEEQTRCD